MKCPQCHSDFPLSWKMYLRLFFTFNRFSAPCCKAKVKFKISLSEIIIMVPLGIVVGMGAAHVVTNNFHPLVKISVISVLLMSLIIDKHLDSKREVILRGNT